MNKVKKVNDIPIFNPDTEDFSVKYDINGDKNPETFTIKARDIAYFPEAVANHIKKHLANHLLNKRGVINRNTELTLQGIYKEIEVDLNDPKNN